MPSANGSANALIASPRCRKLRQLLLEPPCRVRFYQEHDARLPLGQAGAEFCNSFIHHIRHIRCWGRRANGIEKRIESSHVGYLGPSLIDGPPDVSAEIRSVPSTDHVVLALLHSRLRAGSP